MQATNRHPDVSPPPGARDVSSWDTDDRVRVFVGTLRNATAVPVDIAGLQYGDGSVERRISLYAPDLELDVATARKVAADLLDAADELGHHAHNDRALSPHVHKPCRGNGRHLAWRCACGVALYAPQPGPHRDGRRTGLIAITRGSWLRRWPSLAPSANATAPSTSGRCRLLNPNDP
jgi:hypothetical protein